MDNQVLPMYEIRVSGTLGERLFRAFPALDGTSRGGVTRLSGSLDQAALFGALTQIERLGLELLSVHRVP